MVTSIHSPLKVRLIGKDHRTAGAQGIGGRTEINRGFLWGKKALDNSEGPCQIPASKLYD
jgi:hypothetical protein